MFTGVLANDNMPSAFLRQDFTGALEVQPPSPTSQLNYDAHCLALAGERDHLDDSRSVPSFLVVSPAQFLRELEQCSLRFASDEDDLACFGIVICERSRVDSDGCIEELA